MTMHGIFNSLARFSYHFKRVLQILLQVIIKSGNGTFAAGELASFSGVKVKLETHSFLYTLCI